MIPSHCIQSETIDNVYMLRTNGIPQLLQPEDVVAFNEVLTERVERVNSPVVVLNLQTVKYVTSSVLSDLIELDRRLTGQNRQLRLCGLESEVANILEITQLDTFFDIHETEESACSG